MTVDNPGWMDIFNQFWSWKTSQMWTAFPGKCIKYDKVTRQASVEVLVKYLFGEEKVPKSIPNLLEVPVLLPGNQFASINLPKLGSGSFGLVIVANIDITDWILGSGQALLPTEDRRWDISDGFFVPGIFPIGTPYEGEIDDDVLDMSVKSGTKIKIGNGPAELVGMFDELLTLLQGTVDLAGTASTGTNSQILTQLSTLQTKLGQIKA